MPVDFDIDLLTEVSEKEDLVLYGGSFLVRLHNGVSICGG
jgi:hypothetical protein